MNNYNKIIEDVNRQVQEAESEYEEHKPKQNAIDRNFEITHRNLLAEFVGARICDAVKAHLLRTVNLETSLYIATMDEISKATGVSKRTVFEALNALNDQDFIRFCRNGMWAVNPKLIRKGSGGKYIGLLRFYYSLPRKKGET